jgi:predicted ArsR family transcriptional regulator
MSDSKATPTFKIYRPTDPESSRLGAAVSGFFTGSHKKKLCDVLAKHGPMTAKSAARILGWETNPAQKRYSDLKSEGKIRVVHYDDGRPVMDARAEVYELTPEGEILEMWQRAVNKRLSKVR